MNLLATVTLDLVLAFVVLLSLHCACAWGELCGIQPGGDKSGLGGFAAMMLIAGMRWLGVALVLFAVARPGERWWLLGGHLALGCLVGWLFDRSLRRVQDDRVASLTLGIFGGAVAPLPALSLSIIRANSDGAVDSPTALGIVAGVLLLLQGACFRQRRNGMLRPRSR